MKRLFVLATALVMAAGNPVSNVFEIDISPEEAQRYLQNVPFGEPKLSVKSATLPLVRWNDPKFRSVDAGPTLGHYWRNGQEIDNTNDYVEDVYNARQYHGQDGLGAYAWGYEAPESSRVENRQHDGLVKGAYTYDAPNHELVKVNYWADQDGFHQEDNLPKIELQPAQETAEVHEARLAHEKAWRDAAQAAAANPDPQGAYNPQEYNYQQAPPQQHYSQAASQQQSYRAPSPAQPAHGFEQTYSNSQNYNYAGSASEPQGTRVAAPQQQPHQKQDAIAGAASEQLASQVAPPQHLIEKSVVRFQGAASEQQPSRVSYGQDNRQGKAYPGAEHKSHEDEEIKGPPRGFFYSFDYPVSIIVPKSSLGQGQQPGSHFPGHVVDNDTVGIYQQ